jgi:arsenate reductase
MKDQEKITVYEKPTCSKCRDMNKLLREGGYDYSKVNYYLEPLSEAQLRELLKKMNLVPHDYINQGEDLTRELDMRKRDIYEDELIALMIKNPDLIQRPIVERGDRAVLGRPTENVRELL